MAGRTGSRRRKVRSGSKGCEKPFVRCPEGTKAHRSAPGAESLGAGSNGGTRSLVVGPAAMTPGRGGSREVARKPLLRAMKRRTFKWCDEAQCRRAPRREGCNGRRAGGLPFQDCGTTPHILRSTQATNLSPKPARSEWFILRLLPAVTLDRVGLGVDLYRLDDVDA